MSDPSDHPLKRFIGEIHRRSLWQVLGIYVVSGWIVYEVVQSLTEGLGLPSWFPALAFVVLLLGLPIVLATAFVQHGGPAPASSAPSGTTMGELYPVEGASSVTSRLLTWKNAILGGIGAFAVVGVIAVGSMAMGGGIGGAPGVGEAPTSIDPSIAVLSFDDLSPEGDQQYFVEGLSEEIINALTQLDGLKVSARTSAFAFQDSGLDIRTIADSLGVANVLEGSVRRDGDQIRITAQLIEAETGFHLWSDNFDRELTAIFAIQDEIARNIAEHLQLTLTGAQAETLVAGGTESTAAHEAYLRGRFFVSQRTAQRIRDAITEFELAIELDPEYPEAYSGLADSHFLVAYYDVTATLQDRRMSNDQGLIAARRAVQLDPSLGMAHASLGLGLWSIGEWERAEQEFELAIDLDPGYAQAHLWYGFASYTTGSAIEGSHSCRAGF